MQAQFNSETIRAYLDRHLDAQTEQKLEEALILDPELADEVQAEAALRRGFAELKRRERDLQPRANVASLADAAEKRQHRQVAKPQPSFVRYAVAAALFGAVAIPSYLMIQSQRQQADFEARLTARIDSSGARAAYELPASLTTAAPASESSADSPVRLRLPENVREVSLELPSADTSAPTRLQLSPESQPDARITLAGVPMADDQAIGFRVGSERLLPGRYRVVVEREQAGTWVADREFTLNIDAAQR